MSLFTNEYPQLGDTTTVNGNKVQVEEVIQIPSLVATSASQIVFIANGPVQVTAVRESHGTASSSGTLDVVKCTGTTAVGSGTSVMTGTVSLAGTANTVLSGTLSTTTSSLQLAAGDRLGIKLGGTLTSLADCNVTIYIKRL